MKITFTTMLAVAISLVTIDSAFAQNRFEVRRVTTSFPTVYTYGARNHLDELAITLQRQANDITWDMYRNYQGNFEFTETYTEMYELLQSAKHLHDVIHNTPRHLCRNDNSHIVSDLHEMDALFHHIEDDIVNWVPTRHPHHYFHAHGNLQSRIEEMEETLHHLMEDYGIQSNISNPPPVSGATPPPAPTTSFAPPTLGQ